jgi:myo-inositol-1(or 4)-monophosphatase
MALNLPHYQTIAPILKEAGVFLRQSFGSVEAIAQKSNSPADAVTELDRQAETFIAERLQKYDSSIDFYGEEHGGNDGAERFWLLDPIDGTAHYIRGNPFCTTMLALIESGQVTFAVIYNFVTDEMFVAAKSKGAFCNEKPIHVSNRSLSQAYMTYEVRMDQGDNLQKWLDLQKRCVLFNTINCGYEFSQVARGKVEGRVCLNAFGKDWDYAPGSLLVSEAGGVVRNIGSDSYDFRNHSFTATNPQIYKDLQELNWV